MILGADNRKRWSNMDVLVMQAYQGYKNEMCSQHGGPRWLCGLDDDLTEEAHKLHVRMKEVPCYAKREVDKYQKEHEKDQDQVPVVPEFYTLDGSDLIQFRAIYREQERRRAAGD